MDPVDEPPPHPRVPLGDLCEISTGFPLARHADPDGRAVAVIRLADVDGRTIRAPGGHLHLAADLRRLERHALRPGDVLLTARGAALRAGLVSPWAAGAIADGNLLVLRVDGSRLRPAVLWGWLRSRRGQHAVATIGRGSTMAITLSAADLARVRVPVPPMDEQALVAALIEHGEAAYTEAIRAAELRLETLQAVVDGMLADPGDTSWRVAAGPDFG